MPWKSLSNKKKEANPQRWKEKRIRAPGQSWDLRQLSRNCPRDVIFFGQKTPEIISVHDVWEPWKQALLASRDVIISSQFAAQSCRGFFTLGDGCWLPMTAPYLWTVIGHRNVNIAWQKLSWNYPLAPQFLQGLYLGEFVSGAITYFLHPRNRQRVSSVIVSGRMVLYFRK